MLRWISIGLWVLATGCGGVCEFDARVRHAGRLNPPGDNAVGQLDEPGMFVEA